VKPAKKSLVTYHEDVSVPEELPERVPGSVWTRKIFDLLPDSHECLPNCDGTHKAMRWRPPKEHEPVYYWFTSDSMTRWPDGYPAVPPQDHDFTRGPEYPSALPGVEPQSLA
jgi:hypothetical protein